MSFQYSSLTSALPPRFPTPPVKTINFASMPNDLIADGRNFYTEISFINYRTGAFGGFGDGINSIINGLTGGPAIAGAFGALAGSGAQMPTNPQSAVSSFGSLAAIRLPLPNQINDMVTFDWRTRSALSDFGSMMNIIPGVGAISGAVSTAASAIGATIGKTLNPMLYAAFSGPQFRQFTFNWVLAPRTRLESETIKQIVTMFKKYSSPSRGLIMDYPMVALMRMYPNNLNNLAVFKPMVVRSIGLNYTANPHGPSFFESNGASDDGAPTVVTLSVQMMEIKIWTREDYEGGVF